MMKKTLLALSLLGLTGSVVASPFYVDVGANWNGYTTGDSDKVTNTSTSMKDEITYIYESVSTTIDNDASGGLSIGDTIITDGGLATGGMGVGALGNNVVTGFNPSEGFGGIDNDNGYGGGQWLLSFNFDSLVGTVTNYIPGDTLELAYGPGGTFNLFYTLDGTTFQNFMDIQVTGAVTGSGGTLLAGKVDFTTVDALPLSTYNLFHSGGATCAGSTGFYDIWLNCDGLGLPLLEINFLADFNTNLADITISPPDVNGSVTLTGNHDGSAVFNVPEPSTLALFGGTLLLLGASARRRKA